MQTGTVMTGQKTGSPTPAVPRQYSSGLLNGALVLAAISGILHIYIGVMVVGLPLGLPLVLIALVYFVGAGLIASGNRRDLWVKIGLPWVIVIIVSWAASAAANAPGTRDPLAYLDKAAEVVLLVLLLRIRMVRNRPLVVR